MHDHNHHQHHSKNILLAFFLNAGFAIIEFIGGYLTNSVAIYSDALHDIGDSLALLFSYFAEKLGDRQADEKFTFGYRRFSILSALFNGIILTVGSIYVIYEAIARLIQPEPVVPEGMLGLAVLGILVNSIAAYRMSKGDGLNSKMVMYHLLEDILGWFAVLIVSVILLFKPVFVLDSILSILISFVILRGVYRNIMKVFMILLQGFPSEIELEKIKSEIMAVDTIRDIHAIKGWSLDDSNFYLRFHICVPGGMTVNELDQIKHKIKDILMQHNVTYSTIEFEGDDNSCEDS